MVKIFDCFVFGQREVAVLNLRIDTLCHVVDHFIIAQGSTSLSGSPQHAFLNGEALSRLQARCKGKVHPVLVNTRLSNNGTKHLASAEIFGILE